MKRLQLFLLGFLMSLTMLAQTIQFSIPFTDPIDETSANADIDILIYDSGALWLTVDQAAVNKSISGTNIVITGVSVTSAQSYVFTFAFRDEANNVGPQSAAVNYTAPSSGTQIMLAGDAASTSGEANAVTAIWDDLSGTVSIESVQIAPRSGANHIRITSVAGGAVRARLIPNAVIGATYTISIYARRGAVTTGLPRFFNHGGFTTVPAVETIDTTTWTEFTWTLVATATGPVNLQLYPTWSGEAAGGEIYIDDISIIETLP